MTTTTVRELKELRDRCEKLDIGWHPRAKAETLQARIDEVVQDLEPCEDAPLDDGQTMMRKTEEYAKSKGGDEQRNRALEALGRFGHFDITGAASIREYLKLLEAKAGI